MGRSSGGGGRVGRGSLSARDSSASTAYVNDFRGLSPENQLVFKKQLKERIRTTRGFAKGDAPSAAHFRRELAVYQDVLRKIN